MKQMTDANVRDVTNALWAKMVELFPEVETGDLPPEVVMDLEETVKDACNYWLAFNHPDNREEEDL